MKLIPAKHRRQMLANGILRSGGWANELAFWPVVKLFEPDGRCVWLLTEIDPKDHDKAWGLCDGGLGCPAFDCVKISEMEDCLPPKIIRDRRFKARATLASYRRMAKSAGRIVEDVGLS